MLAGPPIPARRRWGVRRRALECLPLPFRRSSLSGRRTTISPVGVVKQPRDVVGIEAVPAVSRGRDHDPVKALLRDRLA